MNQVMPIFPCKSLDELLEFYRGLGFEVTYYQKAPNPCAVVERGWIKLQFYGIKHHDPKLVYHTCYLLTDEVDELYAAFTAAMRKKSGKLPTRGLPRISELRDKTWGVREFMFSDVAGTCIRIGKKIEAEVYADPKVEAASKRLALTLDYAYKSEDEVDELEKVVPMLDKAIAKEKEYECLNLYKVMLLRADLAIVQGEIDVARELLAAVRGSALIGSDPEKYKVELERAADLEARMG